MSRVGMAFMEALAFGLDINHELAVEQVEPAYYASQDWAEVECVDCEEGWAQVPIPGGSWNSYVGTWEPDYRREPCDTCGGTGIIPGCPACRAVLEGDYCPECEAELSEMPRRQAVAS